MTATPPRAARGEDDSAAGPAAAGSPRISVVVPVFDEAENVLPLLSEIHAALEPLGVDFEVVYVDDGSRDGTWERLSAARARFPRLRAIRLRENCGQSTALWVGVRKARGEWIVTLDGDGQNDPADIPRLLALCVEPAAPPRPKMASGIRRRRRDTWLRRVTSRLANALRARLLEDGTPDSGCGLKVFARETFLALPYFDHMHRFLPALVRRAGGEILLSDVNHRQRQRGRSKYGFFNRLWPAITDVAGVMWLQRRSKTPIIDSED